MSENGKYEIRDFIDADQLRRDMAFSTNDLTNAMMEQSSLFAHYGVLHAKAQRQVDAVKMLLESTESAVYKALRNKMESDGKKPTEALLDKMVTSHPRVVGMKRALAEARQVEAIGKTAVEGFRHRRDMLIQQGLISREEMKGEARIAERNARDDAYGMQKESVLQRLRERDSGAEN
jgi:hypothetical protein